MNQTQTDEIVKAIAGGNVQGALWQILNDKTSQLHLERERLLIEERRIREELTPLNKNFDASGIESLWRDFATLARYAEPEEIQRLLRLMIRRVEWKTQGNNKVQFYHLPKRGNIKTNCPPAQSANRQWLYTVMRYDTCNRHGMKPWFWSLNLAPNLDLYLKNRGFGRWQRS